MISGKGTFQNVVRLSHIEKADDQKKRNKTQQKVQDRKNAIGRYPRQVIFAAEKMRDDVLSFCGLCWLVTGINAKSKLLVRLVVFESKILGGELGVACCCLKCCQERVCQMPSCQVAKLPRSRRSRDGNARQTTTAVIHVD